MHGRNKILAVLCLLLMLGVISGVAVACERSFDLVIENRTTQTLTIYLYEGLIGTVAAGGQVTTKDVSGISNMYLIVAKNSQGETVFSKTFSRQDMQQVDGDTFKVVIPASK